MTSLNSSSGKIVGKRKSGRNKSTIDKIKHLLTANVDDQGCIECSNILVSK